MSDLLLCLQVDDGVNTAIMQLLDLAALGRIRSNKHVSLSYTVDAKVLVEIPIVFVDNSVDEVTRAGVVELVHMVVAEISSIAL
jgi:hypothetical protein